MMDDVCKKEMLAGLFLLKFCKDGLTKLGYTTYVSACKALAERVGGNWLSIRNYRDEFDPAFPNGRMGYNMRKMMPSRKEMLDAVGWMDIEEMAELLMEQFYGVEDYVSKLDQALKESKTGLEVAEKSAKVKIEHLEYCLPANIVATSKEGKERIAEAKVRINQSTFRRWTIANYDGACCVTGLNVRQVLEAGHISGWNTDVANRMNPCNGICLSATYHKAFDAHLISFDEDFRLVLSPRLKECCTKDILKTCFLDYEGKAMRMPIRFQPDRKLLLEHLKRLVA